MMRHHFQVELNVSFYDTICRAYSIVYSNSILYTLHSLVVIYPVG